MSTEHPRKALVLAALPHAVERARELLAPGRVLENEVQRAIEQGRLSHEPRRGGAAVVWLSDGVVAQVVRTRSPSGRKAWVPVRVSQTKGGRR